MRVFSRVVLGLLLIFGVYMQSGAQATNTLFFMNGVPQSNRINPARQTECGFYFGIPLASPFSTVQTSSSLSYGDVIYPHPTEDSLITFLHPLGDQDNFLDQLKPMNYVISEMATSILSLGFRTEVGFFTLDISSRFDGTLYIPHDLASLLLEGADEGVSYNMDGLGTDISGFEEVAMGWSKAIGKKLQIGMRGKVLFGLGNLSTTNSEISISPSEDVWHINTDLQFKASLPFADVVYGDDGMIEDIIVDEDITNMNPMAIARTAFSKGNIGLGLDLGIDYRPSGRWLLSASVLDIGYIMWNDNVHELSYIRDYDYTGQEIDPFEFTEDYTFEDYLDSTFSAIGDTLSSALEMGPGEKYSRRLNTKLYLGASWYVTPMINFGLLSRTDFLKEAIVEQLTASANFRAGRYLNFTLSYSYMNSYFKNFGAGVSLNAGPVNVYVISDNVLSTLLWPQEAQIAGLWFGMNLVFGYKQFSKTDVDRPLVY